MQYQAAADSSDYVDPHYPVIGLLSTNRFRRLSRGPQWRQLWINKQPEI